MNKKQIVFKILRILGGVILGFIILLTGLGYYFLHNICDTELVGSYKSPDGTHEAVYTALRCGAISEDVGHVALDGKDVAVMRLGAISVEWINNQILRIEYSSGTTSKMIKEYKEVQIDFVNIPFPAR